MFESEFQYYLHLCELYKAASLTYYEVKVSQLALSVAPPEADTMDLWNRIIKGFTDLGSYDEAYSALVVSPHKKLYVSF
jgi:nuclear pore complex protein Nup160